MGNDPDFLGLGGYHGSDSEGASSSATSSDDSDECSIDSAEVRAAEAQQRLKDYGESHREYRATTVLRSAADVFQEVSGKPAFLNPEATRPLAVNTTHGLAAGAGAAAAGGAGGTGPRGKAAASKDFDVSLLAPSLKGQQQQTDKRGPPGAVIEGKAKRYKLEDGPEATQQYTAAQIAMMGGNAEHLVQQEEEGGGKAARGPATKPMPVSDFLDKGLGGAQLPRKQQDRKDKEKKKRAAGQSTHSHWKSEAEMVLRQQFDS